MRSMRKLFGWFFAFVAVVCLNASARLFILDVVRGHERSSVLSLVPGTAMLLLAIVFAMTWWTSWKDRPTARTWGIAASFLNMSVFLLATYLTRWPRTRGTWELLVVNVFVLIVYGWPDGQTETQSETD